MQGLGAIKDMGKSKTIDQDIVDKVSRKLKDTKEYRKLIRAVNDMDKMKWELPESLSSEDWARIEIDTTAHDANRSATNVFSAFLPKWDVQPRGPEDKDRAKELEDWLDWQFRLVDRRNGSAVWNIMKSAITYDIYCARLDYLPHLFGSNPDKKQKRQMRDGKYTLVEERPENMLWEKTPRGLEWVAVAENVLAVDVAPYWIDVEGADTSKLNEMIEKNPEVKINYFDYEDYDQRKVFFYRADTLNEEVKKIEAYMIYEEKNEKGFISWIISIGGEGYEKDPAYMINPLTAPLHRSGSWENQCLHESLMRSKTLRRWGLPDMITYTIGGEGVEVDYDGGMDQLKMEVGEEAKPYSPPPIDPGMRELVDRGRAKMEGNMGVSTLQNPQATGNTPFSTLDAQIKLSMTSLEKPKRVGEQALTQFGMLCFEWIDYTGDMVKSFRASDSGSRTAALRGSQIDIGLDNFDIEALFINARIIPNSPTDKLQRMNFAIQANQNLRIPISELVESLDLGNSEVLTERWIEEQMETGAVQNFLEKQRAMAQAEVQAALVAATQGQTGGGIPAPQGQANAPGQIPSQQTARGQGFNGEGGSPNQQVSPQDTREQLAQQ